MNILQEYNDSIVEKLSEVKKIPEFRVGDTLRISVKVVEGSSQRIQNFEGVCIGRKNRGITSNFLVRKVNKSFRVERKFLLYSPRVTNIEILRYGKVRQAKIYYMRNLKGKAARIKERTFCKKKSVH